METMLLDRDRPLLQNAIDNCSRRIEEFQVDGLKIGFDKAQIQITNWVNNFEGFFENSEPLIRILNNIEFISDSDILHRCMEFKKQHIDLENKIVFYTCFGAQTESSSRIIRQLNNNTKCVPNISDLLKIIRYNQNLSLKTWLCVRNIASLGED